MTFVALTLADGVDRSTSEPVNSRVSLANVWPVTTISTSSFVLLECSRSVMSRVENAEKPHSRDSELALFKSKILN